MTATLSSSTSHDPPMRTEVADSAAARMEQRRRRRTMLLYTGLVVGLVVATFVSSGSGQLRIPLEEMLGSIAHRLGIDIGPMPSHPQGEYTLWNVRFSRIAMAVIVGGSLAVAGAAMQGVFGNPLAEPSVVGVSSGAAVAAGAAIVFGFRFAGDWSIPACAFVGGLVTTLVVYALSRSEGRTEVVTLVLTGIAVNAVAGALLALLMFLGDTQARESIVFWQLGSLNGSRWSYVWVVAPLAVVGVAISFLCTRSLDLLSLGDRSARHLGVNVERLRIILIVVVALLTAAAVSFCGIVAFVGLVVPHLVRMITGPGHRTLLTVCLLAGALVLICADTVARTFVAYTDLPLGMLTSLVGGPFFFWLLRRTRKTAGGWA